MTVLVKNKKATYNYHIEDKIEAGLVLSGHEVKSLRSKKASLFGAFVSVKNGEAFLLNCNISPYQAKNVDASYNPRRERKLLLRKKEINNLIGKTKEKGVTLIPISIYTKKNFIKLEVAIARGKKKHDKRDAIKKRDIDREIKRRLK